MTEDRLASLQQVLDSMNEWLGNDEGIMNEDIIEWRDALAAALPPPSEVAQPEACINCGERHDGGYTSGHEGRVDEGSVGPFCEQCWELLRETFRGVERPAPPQETKND